MKTFTVVSSDTNSKVTFETNASTIRELLAEFDAHDINYTGMSLYEGLSKAEYNLSNLDGVLPHDLPWKGTVTSNLVFMLTPSKKKYNSGMDRKEAYEAIRTNNWGDAVKAAFGRNFTQVPTEDLVNFIDAQRDEAATQSVAEEDDEEVSAKDFLLCMISMAIKAGIVTKEQLLDALCGKKCTKKEESIYSDDEIDQMFTNI